jgi:hypothetical protein
MNATINTMTIAQIKEQLTAKGIKFSAKTKKETLIELLNKETVVESVEHPEAKEIQMEEAPVVVAGMADVNSPQHDMDKATKIINEVVSSWTELETLSRNEILNEVAISMGEEFVSQNRRALVAIAVDAVQKESEKRANPEEPIIEVVEVIQPKKKRANKKTKKTPVAENNDATTATENAPTDIEEPVVEVVQPKKKRATKKAKEEVVKVDFEEMSLKQIREYLLENKLEKQIEKLNGVMAAIAKANVKKEVKRREPSIFNIFMKEEMVLLKEQFPEKNHKELFATASSNWKTSEKNPKRKE